MDGGVAAFFKTIRWQDILDILINSYILFRVYILFHQTNAFRVITGITILWVTQRIAVGLGLIITSWILQAIVAVAAIIIIVVFRNELRMVLQVHNLRTFLWGSPIKSMETPVDIIAKAVMDMGKKRIGGLLVFPGKEDITELVHGGIPWNGKISQEMIQSIFWPDNPVHDGAAIIEDDTVKEVGVLLPLSQRSDLPTFYGTRHRAALGLAERSDALVVVISEERGRVSVAKNGDIQAVSDLETLRKILYEHTKPKTEDTTAQERRRNRIKSVIAALVSLTIITSIWFGFTRSSDVIIAIEVPIEFMNRPSDLEIIDASPSRAKLHISGASALMRSLKLQYVSVQVDLAKASEGTNMIPIKQENVYLPPGITLNRIEPHFVKVILDRIVTKQVEVQVDWVGHLDDSLKIVSVKVIPEFITVIGGKTLLNSVNTIYTAPVSLNTITQSGSITVPLVIAPTPIRLAPGTPDKVKIEFIVIRNNEIGDDNSVSESP